MDFLYIVDVLYFELIVYIDFRSLLYTNSDIKKLSDLNRTEIYILTSLAFLTIFFGIYPELLLNTINISVNELINNYEISLK